MYNKSLPLYIHQKIFKNIWFDDSIEFKWKLSLNLISKKHFEFISKLYTILNYSLLKEQNLLEKINNPYNCYKYPIIFKCSINQLYSYVRSFYIDKLLSITNGNLTSLNLKLKEPIQINIINEVNQQHIEFKDDMLETLVSNLIKDSNELESCKIKSLFPFIQDYKKSLWDPLLNKDYFLKELSLKMVNINSKQLSEFLENYYKKIKTFNASGLEMLSIKTYQGGLPLTIDSLPLTMLQSIKILNFSDCQINEPSTFIKLLQTLNNLQDLSIDNINLQSQKFNSLNEYQQIFNLSILKLLQSKPNQIKTLNLPFPVEKSLLLEISSPNQSINKLSIIPNSMVKFNNSLYELILKQGYSVTCFQEFCQLNHQSSITKLTINNQLFPSYLTIYFNLFIKNNINLSFLNLTQSFTLLELENIIQSIHSSKNHIETLSINLSENNPQFNNTNYLFYLLSNNENSSIKLLNLKLFFYFQGFKTSLIDSKNFKLIYQKDNFKFKFLKQ